MKLDIHYMNFKSSYNENNFHLKTRSDKLEVKILAKT